MENKVELEKTQQKIEGKKELLVTFQKAYRFEGKDYENVDLTGLYDLKIEDAIDVQRQLLNRQEIAGIMLSETTIAFARELAAKATKKPVEFFQLMPRREGNQIRKMVYTFLNVEYSVENGVLTLSQPYCYKGKEYQAVDLNGITELNTMHESAAENELARAGFVVTENSFNYLYACVIAGMATGLGKEFFTGLPLFELVKLKNAVNSTDFFG